MALMGKYLYCFIKEKDKKSFGTSQIGGLNAPVYTINVEEVAAVVSEAPILDYDPSRKNTMAHQGVLKKVMEDYTVVPVAFGTVANNKKEVEAIIKASYKQFLSNISKLKDKSELGLKVTWKDSFFDKDIQTEEIRELNEKIFRKDENKVYDEKILLGRLVEAAIKEKRESYTKKIYAPLEEIAAESKFKENLPVKTVLNGYFLVDKAKEESFDKKVEALSKEFEDKLVFSYTGPWPPYSFVDMRINIDEITEQPEF
jgi:hypothetical protein